MPAYFFPTFYQVSTKNFSVRPCDRLNYDKTVLRQFQSLFQLLSLELEYWRVKRFVSKLSSNSNLWRNMPMSLMNN